MTDFNQPQYYVRREQQQRMLAARAISPDTRIFHAELADRYARLVEEVTIAYASPRSDAADHLGVAPFDGDHA